MSWRNDLGRVTIQGKKLIAASFRGVPYFVESSEMSGGRRGPVHLYPLRDKPVKEDLGEDSTPYSDVAYVIGDTYVQQKNALLEAIRKPGVGELRHPYHGKNSVTCETWSVSETRAEGGIARFGIEYVNADDAVSFPSVSTDLSVDVVSKHALVLKSIRSKAEQAQSSSPFEFLSGDFLLSSEELIKEVSSEMDKAFAPLLDNSEELANLRARLDALVSSAIDLANKPMDLFDAMVEALSLAFAPPSFPSSYSQMVSSATFTPAKSPFYNELTPDRQLEEDAFAFTKAMTSQVIMSTACAIASDADFVTFQAASSVKTSLIDGLYTVLESEFDDSIFQAVQDLIVSVSKAIPGELISGEVVRKVQIPTTSNSILIAYNTTGSTEHELNICDTNNFTDPGFVLGGTVVEYTDYDSA